MQPYCEWHSVLFPDDENLQFYSKFIKCNERHTACHECIIKHISDSVRAQAHTLNCVMPNCNQVITENIRDAGIAYLGYPKYQELTRQNFVPQNSIFVAQRETQQFFEENMIKDTFDRLEMLQFLWKATWKTDSLWKETFHSIYDICFTPANLEEPSA